MDGINIRSSNSWADLLDIVECICGSINSYQVLELLYFQTYQQSLSRNAVAVVLT